MSADRAHRIWKKGGLQVPRRRPRRRVATGRPRPLPAAGTNEVWVFDACADGQQLKCLTVIDEFTRECLAIEVARQHPIGPRDRDALEAHQRAGRTSVSSIRQRTGVRLARCAAVAPRGRGRNRAHRPRETLAERIERELQREVPRRVSRDAVVREPNRCESRNRRLAAALQRGSTSLQPREPHASTIRTEILKQELSTSRLLGISGPKKPGRSPGIAMSLVAPWSRRLERPLPRDHLRDRVPRAHP